MVSWRFQVDWDSDGDYSEASEDITSRVMAATWNLGMNQPFHEMAAEATMQMTLANWDRRFTPENTGSMYAGSMVPHRLVRVQSIYNGSTITHWTGWTNTYSPTYDQRGELVTVVECKGARSFLQDAEVFLDLLEGVTADEVIRAVLERVQLPPALTQAWVLGVAGNSELGNSTYLADTSVAYDLETGQKTLAYVGDNWADGIKAYSAIADAVMAERGRFFFNRTGQAVFWNRQHLQLITTNAGTINDAMHGLEYTYGGHLANVVQVDCYPRSISATPTDILWQSEETIDIDPGDEKVIRARFGEQNSDAKVGGKDVVTPNTVDGTLAVGSGSVNVAMDADAASATLTLTAGSTGASVTTLVIKGRKMTSYNNQQAEAQDVESITRYGRRVHSINAKLLDDVESAESVAKFELNRRKEIRGEVLKLTLMNKNSAAIAAQLGWEIGTRIRVQETQTAHDAEYFIVGESHDLREGSDHHITTWTLEPASTVKGWLLGVAGRSELGSATYLGF